MICPHCGYKHGYEWVVTVKPRGKEKSDYVLVEGDKGEFWEMDSKFRRNGSCTYTEYYDEANFYACPSCMKTFIKE